MSDPASLLGEARRELARLAPLLEALTGGLDENMARTRPAPGEWAPIEILCHLRDEEREDFGARLHAVLDGQPAFVPIAPERWVDERRYRDAELAATLDDLRTRRAESLAFLASISPEPLQAAVPRGRFGPLSGLDLLVAWVAHDRLHVSQLAATLARLWANRWAPLRAEYAGPIPYPPGDSEEAAIPS
jgi:DinB superfamily